MTDMDERRQYFRDAVRQQIRDYRTRELLHLRDSVLVEWSAADGPVARVMLAEEWDLVKVTPFFTEHSAGTFTVYDGRELFGPTAS
jgi:hypothetical protein